MRKSGPYNLRKGVLTATLPPGIFLLLTEIDGDDPQVEVWVHPDLVKQLEKVGINPNMCGWKVKDSGV